MSVCARTSMADAACSARSRRPLRPSARQEDEVGRVVSAKATHDIVLANMTIPLASPVRRRPASDPAVKKPTLPEREPRSASCAALSLRRARSERSGPGAGRGDHGRRAGLAARDAVEHSWRQAPASGRRPAARAHTRRCRRGHRDHAGGAHAALRASGFVTIAYRNDVSDKEIMGHTRHCSLTTMRSYVRRPKLGGVSPPCKLDL